MSIPLHVLLLEDRQADADLVLYALRRAGYAPVWQRVETEASYLAALDPALDLILADYSLPQFDALRALELLQARDLDIPFIIVSGTIGEEVAVAAMRLGAADYLLKDRLARLGAAVAHALEQSRMRAEMQRSVTALQASARLNQAVLRALTAEIAVLDPAGTIITVNEAWEHFARTHGDPLLSATGIGVNYLDVCRHAADHAHDAEAARALAGLQGLIDGVQSHFSLEYSCQTPEELRWYIMQATPLDDHDGVVVSHEDITERKRAEQARHAAETNYRTLVEHIPAIVYRAAIDATSSTLYVNPQIETMLGFSPTEWVADPQRWLRQLHPGDLDHVLAGVARAHASDVSLHSEFRMLARDGHEVWFRDEAVVVRDPAGQPRFLQGVMLDITTRKQAEQALQESEERFRSYFELGLVGMAITSLTKGILEVNDQLCAILGYDRSELVHLTWAELTHPDDLTADLVQFNQVLAGEIDGYSLEKRWIRKDGQTIDATIAVKCLRRVDGSIGYFVALLQDITERKRLEAQFLQAQKMESVGQLAGGIAHDFNNMLSAVIGFIGSAQEELPHDNPAQRALEIAEQAAWRAARLTRQLLTFARKQIVEFRVLNLNTVIVDLDKMLRRLIAEDIELVILLAAELGHINADSGQLEQIIANLVVNARDAMPNGGKLIVETTNAVLDSDDTQQHFVVAPGAYVRLAVSDTGSGMTAEVQQHIFEPFFTTKEIGKGTGIGLATCYSIVQQHGGTISVDSAVGHGSTFQIYLPRVEAAVDALPQSGEHAGVPRGTETVLLVEDEPLVRELGRTVLKEQGYTVLEAANGEEAWRIIQAASETAIALLVTDVVMPQLGGKALAERVSSMYPSIKVLFVSGYAPDASVHDGRRGSATNFLAKPFTRAAFARKVREVLDS